MPGIFMTNAIRRGRSTRRPSAVRGMVLGIKSPGSFEPIARPVSRPEKPSAVEWAVGAASARHRCQ